MGACGSKRGAGHAVTVEKQPQPAGLEGSPRQAGVDGSETTSCRGSATPFSRTTAESNPRLLASRALMSEKSSVSGGTISKATIIIDNQCPIERHYQVDKKRTRQSSSNGTVSTCVHIATGEKRAVKTITKSQKHLNYAGQEITILKQLDHPNIVKLYETFETHRSTHLIMELCSGGPLLNRVTESVHFSESQASLVMHQILHAVNYMHVNHSLCHRDLRLDSVLFTENGGRIEESTVKLTDLGYAKVFKKGQIMTSKVGSIHYMSPQVLACRYDESCDSWSIGVMTYMLLCGYPPFYGEDEPEVLAKLKKGTLSFEGKEWAGVSQGAKDLIQNLLNRDSSSRYTTQDALSHSWIKDRAPKATDFALHAGFIDHLRCFGGTNDLKKTALYIIAGQMMEEQIKMLRSIFVALDQNGDGLLTVDEMREGMRQAGVNDLPDDFADIVEALACHTSGGVDYTEFLAASLEKRHYLKESVCWKAFSVFDRNCDGNISRDELEEVLNSGASREEIDPQAVEQLMKDFDNNGDDMLNFEEFMLMMLRNCSPRRGDCHTLGVGTSKARRSPKHTVM